MRDLPLLIEDYPSDAGPLRIALVTETYPPEINGVAMTLGRMVHGLRRRGHYGYIWPKRPIGAYLRKFHNNTGLTLVPTEALRRELEQQGYRSNEALARLRRIQSQADVILAAD